MLTKIPDNTDVVGTAEKAVTLKKASPEDLGSVLPGDLGGVIRAVIGDDGHSNGGR